MTRSLPLCGVLSCVLLGAAVSVTHAGLGRGWRTGVGVLLLVVGTAVVVEAIGLATGFPYGEYRYGDVLGPRADLA